MDIIKVSDISSYLEAEIPTEMKEPYDNVGLLIGFEDKVVTRVLVALDITEPVIAEACEMGAELIISHHPLFFSCESIRSSSLIGRKVIRLIEGGMSAICMHTNLDAVSWGVNSALAQRLDLGMISLLLEQGRDSEGNPYGMPRVGVLEAPLNMEYFLKKVKSTLNSNGLRYHDSGRLVQRVAVCGGSGGSFLEAAVAQGCDTLVTSDIKYNIFLEAKEMGINIIDGDHFATENLVCPVLRDKLKEKYPQLEVAISAVHRQTAKFY